MENDQTRKGLIARFGIFADPSNLVRLDAALERVIRLPCPYSISVGLPVDLGDRERADLLAAWKSASFLVGTAVLEAWEAALVHDQSGYGKPRLEMAIDLLQCHVRLLLLADVGAKLLEVNPASLTLIGVHGRDWQKLVTEAMQPRSELHAFLQSLPAWEKATFKRRTDPKWCARQLKRARERVEAHVAWVLGAVDGKKRPWASQHAIDVMEGERIWSAEWAAKHFMVREPVGADLKPTILTMKHLLEMSVKVRRSEDYALAIGMQQTAEKYNLQFVLVTVTLPGEWSPVRGRRASKWNGKSPAQANIALKSLMHRIRTNLVDGDGICIGFCVTEPQKSGVPHCHIMILTDDPSRVERIVLSYKQGSNHQIDVRRWHMSPAEGNAASIASYLTKYLMKGKELEELSEESLAMAAWRRGANCRTTSWFGLGRGFKGKWRAVYRAQLNIASFSIKSKSFNHIKGAMAAKEWGKALAMCGDMSKGGLPVEKYSATLWEPIKETRKNRYDEIVDVIVGWKLETGEEISLKTGKWELGEVIDENWDHMYDWEDLNPDPSTLPPKPTFDFDLELSNLGY